MATSAEVQALTDTIISNAIAVSNARSKEMRTYTDSAMSSAVAIVTPGNISFDQVDEPDEFPVPESGSEGSDISLFHAIKDHLIELATERISSFLTTHFPNLPLYSEADDWIIGVIEGTRSGTGLSAGVVSQIWDRDRNRLEVSRQEQRDSAISEWAARGFSVPAGVLQERLDRIEQLHSDQLSSASRDIAIKEAEIQVENMRLAIQQAMSFRISAIGTAVDYIRAVMLGAAEIGAKLALDQDSKRAALISASAAYYNAKINAREITLRRALALYEGQLKQDNVFVSIQPELANARARAAVGAAKSAGDQAAAALSALNAIGQLAST